MDKTVIILISAGVCCVMIGITLFIKLCTMKMKESDGGASKQLLDPDYKDNFEECFENTGNIEETLEQLAHIYSSNQYMHSLIQNAYDYLHEGGDYESALEKINVDSNIGIMKMHDAAIKKSLNLIHKSHKKEPQEFDANVIEVFDEDTDENIMIEKPKKKKKDVDDRNDFRI